MVAPLRSDRAAALAGASRGTAPASARWRQSRLASRRDRRHGETRCLISQAKAGVFAANRVLVAAGVAPSPARTPWPATGFSITVLAKFGLKCWEERRMRRQWQRWCGSGLAGAAMT